MDDYVNTLVLPQKAVENAIDNTEDATKRADAARNHAAAMLEETSNSARITSLNNTIGHIVDVQIGHERRLAETSRQMGLIERELRHVEARVSSLTLMVLALVLILAWVAM